MRTLVIASLLLLAGCGSQHFTESDPTAAHRPALPKNCPVKLISVAPPAGTYVELGLCDVSVPGGGIIMDNSHKATKKLRECACAAGGNAVLFLSDKESNAQTTLGFGASQWRVSGKGSVLWIDAP